MVTGCKKIWMNKEDPPEEDQFRNVMKQSNWYEILNP